MGVQRYTHCTVDPLVIIRGPCCAKPLQARGSIPFLNMRSRGWCFTLNNYTQAEYIQLQEIDCRYIILGKEIGATGTPHIQGYVYFDNAKSRRTVSRLCTRAHLEPRYGSNQQATDYCKKEGSFWEKGTPPMDSEEARKKGSNAVKVAWDIILDHVRRGDTEWVAKNYPKIYIQLKPRLESLHQPTIQPILGELDHEWWVGPSGSGKSRLLWELYPTHYEKPLNKWWDGYKHEPIVAIEEWSPANTCTTSALKRWADRYPFAGEIKGGVMCRLRPRKIIVLSNYTIEQCFTMREDQEPMLRRFKVMKFPDDIENCKYRAAWLNEQPEEPILQDSDSDLDILPDMSLDEIFTP